MIKYDINKLAQDIMNQFDKIEKRSSIKITVNNEEILCFTDKGDGFYTVYNSNLYEYKNKIEAEIPLNKSFIRFYFGKAYKEVILID